MEGVDDASDEVFFYETSVQYVSSNPRNRICVVKEAKKIMGGGIHRIYCWSAMCNVYGFLFARSASKYDLYLLGLP